MAGMMAIMLGCTFFCGDLFSGMFGSDDEPAEKETKGEKDPKKKDRRDMSLFPGAQTERIGLLSVDGEPTQNYTNLYISTNGILSNTTANFTLGDGTSVLGNLTGHAAHFRNGVGHGNWSCANDTGRWISVDLSEGAEDVTEFWQSLLAAGQDGLLTSEELEQAVALLEEVASS